MGFGWTAIDQAHLEQNWAQFDFQMFIDGREVDLDAFGTLDITIPVDLDGDGTPENIAVRILNVVFDGLSGSHDVRAVQTVRQAVDDGFQIFPAGTYEWLATMGAGGG